MPPAYFLNAPTAKVGKSAGRNLRFLHLRARYNAYEADNAYHTFTQDFLFCTVNRIVSAPAPLPLMRITHNAVGSAVEKMSGSGAGRKSMRHTKRNETFSANAW